MSIKKTIFLMQRMKEYSIESLNPNNRAEIILQRESKNISTKK